MPFAESHDLPEFKAWLVRTLEPMCDADPVVMSDYIIALLKHEANYNDDQWREFISRELADFLEDKSAPFVNYLWQTLSSRSFLSTPAVSIAPSAAVASERTAQVAAAGPSGNGPSVVSSYRPPNAPAGPSRTNGMPGGPIARGPVNGTQPGGKQKCFDYHNRGFCLRGATCPYEHSDDMIIPSQDMRFQQYPQGQMAGRGRGRGGLGGPGPSNQGERGPPNGRDMPPHQQQQSQQPDANGDFPFGMPFPMAGFPGMPGMPFPFFPGMQGDQKSRRDQDSEFWGTNKPPHHTERTSTLVITDIPTAQLSVPVIREYFTQFGEVTNVALEARTKRAMVTFDSNREAYNAWKSDEAVFGSRHVKVLWHRPRPGQGEAGQKALEASAGLVGNLNKMDNGNADSLQGGHSAKLFGQEQSLRNTLARLEQKERQQKRETLMAEQKVLMAKTKSADQATKLEILKRLKAVAKEMEDLDKPKEVSADVDMDEKSALDRELEKHGMESVGKRDEEELLKLNAQLNALKEKASALGVASTPSRYSPYPTRGGNRGRGAPRGRGRGAFVTGHNRLDNRSRAVIIGGEGLAPAKQAVREWYEGHGGNVEEYNSGEGWKVVFPNRDMAEKVLNMGTKSIPSLTGELRINWDTEAPVAYNNGGGGSGGGGGERDVEMVEDTQRGERDEDE